MEPLNLNPDIQESLAKLKKGIEIKASNDLQRVVVNGLTYSYSKAEWDKLNAWHTKQERELWTKILLATK